jgi:hypothetical protein
MRVSHTPQQTPTHPNWCHEHTPEGCLSEEVKIPGLPHIAVWVTTTSVPGLVQFIIDGPGGGHTVAVHTG